MMRTAARVTPPRSKGFTVHLKSRVVGLPNLSMIWGFFSHGAISKYLSRCNRADAWFPLMAGATIAVAIARHSVAGSMVSNKLRFFECVSFFETEAPQNILAHLKFATPPSHENAPREHLHRRLARDLPINPDRIWAGDQARSATSLAMASEDRIVGFEGKWPDA